jgi:hypothetical protein
MVPGLEPGSICTAVAASGPGSKLKREKSLLVSNPN